MAVRKNLALDRTLLCAGERVCVAVSGGADSTALLLALLQANIAGPQNKQPLGLVLSAAHVHHGLRGAEADADAAFVRELCERLAVPFRAFNVDVASRQALTGEGLEEAARAVRYRALRSLGVDAIATAHTLDDQAETVMMKLLRGAWTEGLGGISPVVEAAGAAGEKQVLRSAQDDKPIWGDEDKPIWGDEDEPRVGRIVRPLLGVSRAEVEAFLKENGQTWREDSSNRDLTLTRNRVRHQLMPLLRSFNSNVDELLARTAGIARDDEAFWQAETARLLPQLLLPGKPVRGGGRAVGTAVGERASAVEIARLAALAPALRRRVVRAAARQAGVGLSAEETARVLALAGFGGFAGVTGRIGSRLELHGGLRVERSARELRFEGRA
jgi:tRNA(Ile)-lysidine synthase